MKIVNGQFQCQVKDLNSQLPCFEPEALITVCFHDENGKFIEGSIYKIVESADGKTVSFYMHYEKAPA